MRQEDTPPPRQPFRARLPLPRLSRRMVLELAGAALVGGTLGRLVSVFNYHPSRYIYRGHLGSIDGIEDLAWSPNSQRVASGAVNMQVWDALTGAHIQTFPSDGGIQAVAWSPNGKYLASGDQEGIATVWETTTGKELLTYRGHVDKSSLDGSGARTALSQPRFSPRSPRSQDGGLNDLAWSPDGSLLLSTGPDFLIRVWEALTGRTLWAGGDSLDYPVWSPDGRLIAGVAFNGVGFLDAATGQPSSTPEITFDASNVLVVLNSLAWSPNGRYLAAPGYPIGGVSYPVYVWEAATGRTVQTYRGHTDQARAVAWSPNSTYLASAGADMTVRIWEATTGQTRYIYYGHMGFLQQFFSVQAQETPSQASRGPLAASAAPLRTQDFWGSTIKALVWSPDGQYIASGDEDAIVQVWQPG